MASRVLYCTDSKNVALVDAFADGAKHRYRVEVFHVSFCDDGLVVDTESESISKSFLECAFDCRMLLEAFGSTWVRADSCVKAFEALAEEYEEQTSKYEPYEWLVI